VRKGKSSGRPSVSAERVENIRQWFVRSPHKYELNTGIREACANTDQEILNNVTLTLNFTNDKLLFIKLFQLIFNLVRVL
jgi:hypothetical protein